MRLGLVDDRIQKDRPEARQLSPARQKERPPKSAALRSSLDRKRRGLIKTQGPGARSIFGRLCAARIRIVERPSRAWFGSIGNLQPCHLIADAGLASSVSSQFEIHHRGTRA